MVRKKGNFADQGKQFFRPSSLDELMSETDIDTNEQLRNSAGVQKRISGKPDAQKDDDKERVRRLNIQIREDLFLWILDEINLRQRDPEMVGKRSQRAVVEEGIMMLKEHKDPTKGRQR